MNDHPLALLLAVREAFDDYVALDGRTREDGRSPWERLYSTLTTLPSADELRSVTNATEVSPIGGAA